MKKYLLIIITFFTLLDLSSYEYRSPSERFLEKESWEKIVAGLKSLEISCTYRDFLNPIAEKEQLGFVGYHGSTHEFRIYQDIIKWVLEDILEMPIREDFHFFRIPGDPLFAYNSLEEYGSYLNDYSPTYFICLNYAIYSNYKSDFFSTFYYFSKNSSSSNVNFEEKLVWLFDKIGLDKSIIPLLFSVGRSHFSSSKTGIIFQIFDMSHLDHPDHPYEYTNPLIGTFAHNDMPFSEAVEGTEPTHFYLQTRLLMSNRYTLNPYSPLIIKRYERTDPEIVANYEQQMHQIIQTVQADPVKAEFYKAELRLLWNVCGHTGQ
jgi:hypothetical protein